MSLQPTAQYSHASLTSALPATQSNTGLPLIQHWLRKKVRENKDFAIYHYMNCRS